MEYTEVMAFCKPPHGAFWKPSSNEDPHCYCFLCRKPFKYTWGLRRGGRASFPSPSQEVTIVRSKVQGLRAQLSVHPSMPQDGGLLHWASAVPTQRWVNTRDDEGRTLEDQWGAKVISLSATPTPSSEDVAQNQRLYLEGQAQEKVRGF